MKTCTAITLNTSRPCRAPRSRMGGTLCPFHRGLAEERLLRYLTAVNRFSGLTEEVRLGNAFAIVLTPLVVSSAETFIQNWLEFDELVSLVNSLGDEPVPEDGREYAGALLTMAGRVISAATGGEIN